MVEYSYLICTVVCSQEQQSIQILYLKNINYSAHSLVVTHNNTSLEPMKLYYLYILFMIIITI